MDIRKSDHFFLFLQKNHSRYNELNQLINSADFSTQSRKIQEISRELHSLRSLEENYHEYKKLLDQIVEAELIQESSVDKELVELAQEELVDLYKRKDILQKRIENLLISDIREESRNVFIEIRAGTGGDEASLFATDLLRMYARVAEKKKWKFETISIAYSSIGGIKEAVVYLKGNDVYKFLQHESGVHRVQRVPTTEASGRIHTSTVTVAVLPEADSVDIQIDPKDVRIDTFAASGPGGQHVNKTESAIRITHFPTGIVVTCQDEKSQHKNKEKALKVLQARLLEFEKQKHKDNIDQTRKSQIGNAERSEKIRTYNFPQNRVTDHRIVGKMFNIEFILDGEMQELVDLLNAEKKKSLIREKIESSQE